MHFPNIFKNHFCWSLLIFINKLITNTWAFKLYSCIIVTKNLLLAIVLVIFGMPSENISQPEYFLFRMKPTAAPWASKRSMATYCSQFQRFKHSLKSSFSSALPRSFSRNVFFIVAVNKWFLRIFGENIHNKTCIKERQQLHVSNISEMTARLTAKLDFSSCKSTESLQGWAA